MNEDLKEPRVEYLESFITIAAAHNVKLSKIIPTDL